MKSNKVDTEMTMKGLDILHKQITHIIVLMIEQSKIALSTSLETEKQKQQKKHFILKSAVHVCQWINKFDPQNVNNDDLYLPTELT